jgi:SDR family mycofactocin-dependent oxidoreductase
MTNEMEGKVALITGAGRGQGRSHALLLAEEGADIVAVDICSDINPVGYPMSTWDDLEETRALVAGLGRRVIARQVDVRNLAQLQSAVADAMQQFGRLDMVCANAGIIVGSPVVDMTEDQWDTTIGVNLSGVWRTFRAALPAIVAGGRGGSAIAIGSVGSVRGAPNIAAYDAAKHGILGLVRCLAHEMSEHHIRVNAVLPTTVDTMMANNSVIYSLMRPDLEHPTLSDVEPAMRGMNLLPTATIDPIDISNAVLWLASDRARYVTGIALPVDAGSSEKYVWTG